MNYLISGGSHPRWRFGEDPILLICVLPAANLCTASQSKKPSLCYGESPKEVAGYRVIYHGYTIPNRIR